jgi:hypothetical protein
LQDKITNAEFEALDTIGMIDGHGRRDTYSIEMESFGGLVENFILFQLCTYLRTKPDILSVDYACIDALVGLSVQSSLFIKDSLILP